MGQIRDNETALSHSGNPRGKKRCVQGEDAHGRAVCTLFLFRHDDGCWYVFPPSDEWPWISSRHRDKVTGMIEQGRVEGGEVLAGGSATYRPGFFVQPSVFAHYDNKPLASCARKCSARYWSPCLTTISIEAIAAANASEYGLGASMWTNRLDRTFDVIDFVKAGTARGNSHNMVDPALPFGGFKSSDDGREHGR
ncbi:acyl-CoA reductase-like NAD-dependent aldehyde dehydrogenase [Caballeronia udeis]|uniref:aldehyde dehydrogenase family protein n=1 Tax=Caballeronia udeis TaxID=1232866 RepID=UPI003832B5B1